MINIDEWISGYKVRAFDWIDPDYIYVNIQYVRPGDRISNPTWDKSFLLPNTENNREALTKWRHFNIEYLAGLPENFNQVSAQIRRKSR